MPLVYLPASEALFAWGDDAWQATLSKLKVAVEPGAAQLLTPEGLREIRGGKVALLDAVRALATVPSAELESLSASVAIFALASKLALELVANERVVPTITRRAGRIEARWAAALCGGDDAVKMTALARSMPPAAHAVPVLDQPASRQKGMQQEGARVWARDALLRAYLDAAVDALVRAAQGGPELQPLPKPLRRSGTQAPEASWNERWQGALSSDSALFETQGFGERSVVDDLERWSAPALGARDRLRACFRLELPEGEHEPFQLRFLLQAPDDPSLLVPAKEVWTRAGRTLATLGRAFRDPQESLLEALGRARRLFAPIGAALESAQPEAVALDPAAAWAFLADGAAALGAAGFGVIVPAELTAAGQRRLRLRMRVGEPSQSKVAGVVSGGSRLGLDELLTVDWEAVVGDSALTAKELTALAKQKAPLVRFRGTFVAVDPGELSEIRRRIAAGPERMTVRAAVQAALAGEAQVERLNAVVSARGVLADLLERLSLASVRALPAPGALAATLRPYQERGLHWLVTMATLGLGACLADDMGLGKTMQLLAFLLARRETAQANSPPALLVASTSVVGNWEREIERFAPVLRITRHYGSERLREKQGFPRGADALVLTTYGLLRRDAALLASAEWSVVVLDEAQNIKNAASATARAARALPATQRFALTGTPVENRLAELWSILEFANPGLLGPLETFRREFAAPIERYGDDAAATRLRRMVSPFILRREKSDPSIIQDLPPKHEMKVVCTLSREQATLYKAAVDEELRRIAESTGIERRGRVLALLTFTKQICNHPAQYLGESGPLAKRSGKLSRVTEMLEEALSAGDKALVFTQFREMGNRLVSHLQESLDCEVQYLHGGTTKKARDAMVQRFQDDPRGPRVFVLSLKAGGTGLNLTAASHVFHYDRWWNPAVEDQATDRAYRIGQTKAVQVHKLVCAGTVEDKIDRLLEQKRELQAKVVGSGEQWITELGTDQLRELFALSDTAVAIAEGDDMGDEPSVLGAGARTRTSKKRAPRHGRREAQP